MNIGIESFCIIVYHERSDSIEIGNAIGKALFRLWHMSIVECLWGCPLSAHFRRVSRGNFLLKSFWCNPKMHVKVRYGENCQRRVANRLPIKSQPVERSERVIGSGEGNGNIVGRGRTAFAIGVIFAFCRRLHGNHIS